VVSAGFQTEKSKILEYHGSKGANTVSPDPAIGRRAYTEYEWFIRCLSNSKLTQKFHVNYLPMPPLAPRVAL